jgi:hypothetical protein
MGEKVQMSDRPAVKIEHKNIYAVMDAAEWGCE